MAGPQKKKRQHYVPKLILREFSEDGKSTSLVVMATGRRVDGASLGSQCYEDYFYGMDGQLEDAFGISEGKFRSAIGNLSREHLESLSKNDLYQIRLFAHYQLHRTLGAAGDTDTLTAGLAERILAKTGKFDASDLKSVQITLTQPQRKRPTVTI